MGGFAGGGRHRGRPHRHRRDRDRRHQRDRRAQSAGRLTDPAGGVLGRPPDALARPATRGGAIVRRPRRHAGVFRRAARRELDRLREPRRIAAVVVLGIVLGVFAAGLAARGEAAGADAHAYWAGVRIWLAGGDPYKAVGPFMPYVYAPWMLPLFLPWALLPWDVAWFAWRGATILLLLWTVAWAYRQRPLETAVVVVILSIPIAANIDTGNINLVIVFMLWAAQIVRPVIAGGLWALATAMKWVPVVFIGLLAPRARGWGLVWAGVAVILTLATLPATVVQVQAVFAFPRPARIDYLVLLWAAVPWVWRHPAPLWWVRPSTWPGIAGRVRGWVGRWGARFRASPRDAAAAAARILAARTRSFFGIA